LNKIEPNSISSDIEEMRKTKLLNMYCKNKTHCLMEEYLTDPMMTWGNKQLILQLKQGISHITWKGKVARLRKLEKLYHNEVDPKCQLCEKEDEDLRMCTISCLNVYIIRKKD